MVLEGSIDGGKKYKRCKNNLETAMEKKKRVELEAALEDFESLLITDDVRAQEKTILVTAYSECQIIWASVFPKS